MAKNIRQVRRLLAVAIGTTLFFGSSVGRADENSGDAGVSIVAWEIDFESADPGAPAFPEGWTDTAMFALRLQGKTPPLPFRAFAALDYVLPTRTAKVVQGAFGMKSNVCRIDVTDGDRSIGASRGPSLLLDVPVWLRAQQRWCLQFDLAAGQRMQMGTLSACFGSQGGFRIGFYNDNRIKVELPAGIAEICPYQPSRQVSLMVLIDNAARTFRFGADRQWLFTLPFPDVIDSPFTRFRIMGMDTGPHCSPGSYAIDNIRLIGLPAGEAIDITKTDPNE